MNEKTQSLDWWLGQFTHRPPHDHMDIERAKHLLSNLAHYREGCSGERQDALTILEAIRRAALSRPPQGLDLAMEALRAILERSRPYDRIEHPRLQLDEVWSIAHEAYAALSGLREGGLVMVSEPSSGSSCDAEPPIGNAVGAAEAEVGRWVYRRIEALMDAKPGTPEGAELQYLARVAESVEEYGEEACAGHGLGPPIPIGADWDASNDEQVQHMVSRFLGWRLPENFSPDAGISFNADFNEHTRWPMTHQPVGTNLFDAAQATAMVRYMIEGLPPLAEPPMGSGTASGKHIHDGAALLNPPTPEPGGEGRDWRPIESAPRDGRWFEARCDYYGTPIVRRVHFAAPCDRLPVCDTRGKMWPTVPTEWRALSTPLAGGDEEVKNMCSSSIESTGSAFGATSIQSQSEKGSQ